MPGGFLISERMIRAPLPRASSWTALPSERCGEVGELLADGLSLVLHRLPARARHRLASPCGVHLAHESCQAAPCPGEADPSPAAIAAGRKLLGELDVPHDPIVQCCKQIGA